MVAAQVLVLAKAPVPGRVKTRLTPALTPEQAAAVARAALEDTLDAVRRSSAARRVLVMDGDHPASGFVVQHQCRGPLDRRLAHAFDRAWAEHPLPALVLGMDTPQLSTDQLDAALAALVAPGVDAVLGAAEDGGWWALGLRRPDGSLLRGVPTSRPDTGARQRRRLASAGLRVVDLPVLRDVDSVDDLRAVSRAAPAGRFAATVARVLP